MTFTISKLIDSIAGTLKTKWNTIPVYESTNQQGTDYPCFFVFLVPSNIRDQIDQIEMRNLSFDVVYVQERNSTNGEAELYEIADALDDILDMITYSDGSREDPVPLHTHDRECSIEDQELHYQITIKQRVSHGREHNPMYRLEELNVNILRKGTNVLHTSGVIAIPVVNQITTVTEITGEDMYNAVPGDMIFGGAVASTFLQHLTGEDITNVSDGNMNFGGAAGITVLNAVGG